MDKIIRFKDVKIGQYFCTLDWQEKPYCAFLLDDSDIFEGKKGLMRATRLTDGVYLTIDKDEKVIIINRDYAIKRIKKLI